MVSRPGNDPRGPAPHDAELTARLRARDEAAFRELVKTLHGPLTRLARSFCRNESVAEEALQETWLAVIKGIAGFEGRSPLKSWIFGILVNQARRLAVKEHKRAQVEQGMPHNAGPDTGADPDVEPGMGANGRWHTPPAPWGLENPESLVMQKETLGIIEDALESMPDTQREVILLRDVEGLAAEEVCNILGVSETNVRVLLHRGRTRVRRALDAYMKEGTSATSSRKERSRTS